MKDESIIEHLGEVRDQAEEELKRSWAAVKREARRNHRWKYPEIKGDKDGLLTPENAQAICNYAWEYQIEITPAHAVAKAQLALAELRHNKMFNPDYLKFKDGVKVGRSLERQARRGEIEKAVKAERERIFNWIRQRGYHKAFTVADWKELTGEG